MKKQLTILCAAVPLITAACAGNHANQARDARTAQIDSSTRTRTDQIEQRADAQKKQIDNSYESSKQNAEDMGRSSDASDQLTQLSKERAEYQVHAREQLDKVGTRIDSARQKLMVLGGRAPSSLGADLDTAQRQHQMIANETTQLNSTPDDLWDSTTKRLDNDMDELDSEVSKIESKIDSVQ
jgi:hypothetical protein